MNAIMKMVDSPALMRGAVENRRMAEELAAARAANAVLTAELESAQEDVRAARREARLLRAERDDARHERDELRARRDRAYTSAVTANRVSRKSAKKIERALFALLTAAWGIPAMVILCGKAWEWIRWMIGR